MLGGMESICCTVQAPKSFVPRSQDDVVQRTDVARFPAKSCKSFGAGETFCFPCRRGHLAGITCQFESGVRWIQISLWRFEARNHLRLVKKTAKRGESSDKLFTTQINHWHVYSIGLLFQRRCLFSIYAISGFPAVLWYYDNRNLCKHREQLSWTV